ncbi:TRAP transporter substrate-binding protein [Cognatishimia activa]|uniref:TRAP transporter solute receptor, DctP family n=1 Tax=Cognatishimia activa TaxID=1715691 RepID=A0A0P1IRM5_9RHOB|nr:TRAP transporter substrate-binding protein [Cognatishimia activa]MEE2944216.1 TRAP transporter substrate-binding protein [Pseudomonadota bacterium]CUJ00115.1 TRAP transporter solute receptor, DctP family [Cognatishimia activa]CUK26213.1 TRAP transporter solute receptor, DctP family [Cognatishimia activa]
MTIKTNRRNFLTTAAVATAAGGLAAPAYATGKRTLKMATGWPKKFPGLGVASQRIGDAITAASDGRLTVEVFGAGELVPPFEAFDAVASGAADLYHAAEYYWQGKSTAFNFFAGVPFGMTTAEHNAWIYHRGGQELWEEVSASFGVIAFMAGNSSAQAGGWFNKEINSVDDLKGLKMRIPGFGGKVIDEVGGTAVTLPGGEIFSALQSGAIDAGEMAGPWIDLGFGFYKAAKYFYNPGFQEPTSAESLGVNLDLWNDMSAADQQVIKLAAAQENVMNPADFIANHSRSLDILLKEHGVELRSFPDEVMIELGKATKTVLADAAAADPLTGKVYESYMEFLDEVSGWTEQSEQAYLRARSLARAS